MEVKSCTCATTPTQMERLGLSVTVIHLVISAEPGIAAQSIIGRNQQLLPRSQSEKRGSNQELCHLNTSSLGHTLAAKH